jgi:hypothetical protein
MSSTGISRTLKSLHSILDIPEESSQPIRLHHTSFQDFLLDRKRCVDARFWVDRELKHKFLAETCLSVMCEGLREDICDLKSPGTLTSEINCGLVEAHLPPVLQYACCYWADHVTNAGDSVAKGEHLKAFLKGHFLHWLEALSLLGRLSDTIAIVVNLELLMVNRSC